LSLSKDALELPTDSTAATLRNNGKNQFSAKIQHQWFVATDSGWDEITPSGGPLIRETIQISPGGTKAWEITADTSALETVYTGGARPEYSFRFTPGEYAFGCLLHPESEDTRQFHVVTFSVMGSKPLLVESKWVNFVREDGSTRIVRMDPVEEFEHDRRITLLADSVSQPNAMSIPITRFELYNPLYIRRQT